MRIMQIIRIFNINVRGYLPLFARVTYATKNRMPGLSSVQKGLRASTD